MRTPGGHRRFERNQILALRDALRGGYMGESAALTAKHLYEQGWYTDPPGVLARIERVENEVRSLRKTLEAVVRELRRINPELQR